MNTSESIKEIATALCKFQGEVEKIRKEATNPFFKSKYATLANILDVIREPLHKNGLSFVQFPTNQFGLITRLMHQSGEWMEAEYVMQPKNATPHEIGACITYMRRYALGSILGLNIDNDDDGNKASQPVSQPQLTAEQKQMKDIAMKDVASSQTVSGLEDVWKSNAWLQSDTEFKNAVKSKKSELEK